MLNYFRLILLLCSFALSGYSATHDIPIQTAASLLQYCHDAIDQVEDQIRQFPEETPIVFSEKDLHALWNRLIDQEMEASLKPYAEKAYHAWMEACQKREDLMTRRGSLRKASLHLIALWQKLNNREPRTTIRKRLQDVERKIGKAPHDDDMLPMRLQDRHLTAAFLDQLPEPSKEESEEKPLYNDFLINPFVSPEMRKAIAPFVLPSDHALKPVLDAIFGATRATVDETSMKNAGFSILFAKPRSFIRVSRHQLLPEHLIKANLDSITTRKQGDPAWKWLVRRCQGSRQMRQVIEERRIEYFQVPRKWLYPLPLEPSPPVGAEFVRQPVVLLAEDMHLVSEEENLDAWKNQITPRHLDELYVIISRAGGASYRPDNVWLSSNGKFSLIDTEYPDQYPHFDGFRDDLSEENQAYWDQLIRHGGPSSIPSPQN